MTREAILKEIQPIFQEVLDNESLELKFETSAYDVPEWDSLHHAMLIGSVRKHFGVKFPLKDVLDLKTVGDLCDLVLRVMAHST